MAWLICRHCGRHNAQDSESCASCGMALSEPLPEEAEKTQSTVWVCEHCGRHNAVSCASCGMALREPFSQEPEKARSTRKWVRWTAVVLAVGFGLLLVLAALSDDPVDTDTHVSIEEGSTPTTAATVPPSPTTVRSRPTVAVTVLPTPTSRPRLLPTPTFQPRTTTAPTPAPKSPAITLGEAKELATMTILEYARVRDASIQKEGRLISLVLIVDYATSEDYAKQLADNFVRMFKSLSDDDPPAKEIGRGIYDYLVGVYFPNESVLVLGGKVRASPHITWR